MKINAYEDQLLTELSEKWVAHFGNYSTPSDYRTHAEWDFLKACSVLKYEHLYNDLKNSFAGDFISEINPTSPGPISLGRAYFGTLYDRSTTGILSTVTNSQLFPDEPNPWHFTERFTVFRYGINNLYYYYLFSKIANDPVLVGVFDTAVYGNRDYLRNTIPAHYRHMLDVFIEKQLAGVNAVRKVSCDDDQVVLQLLGFVLDGRDGVLEMLRLPKYTVVFSIRQYIAQLTIHKNGA